MKTKQKQTIDVNTLVDPKLLKDLGFTQDDIKAYEAELAANQPAQAANGQQATYAKFYHPAGKSAAEALVPVVRAIIIKAGGWVVNENALKTSKRADGTRSCLLAYKQEVPDYDEETGKPLPKGNISFYTKEAKLVVCNPQRLPVDLPQLGFKEIPSA